MELRTEAEARCGALFLCMDQTVIYMKAAIHGIVVVIIETTRKTSGGHIRPRLNNSWNVYAERCDRKEP